MHVHVVLVKLADPAQAETCMTAMRSMQGRIPGMIDLECAHNEIDVETAADVMLRTTWTDRAAYDAYQVDPVHTEVAELVRSLMVDATTMDWTT